MPPAISQGSPRYLRDLSEVDKEQEGSGTVSNTTNPNCPQSLVDSNPLPTNNYIRPVPPVRIHTIGQARINRKTTECCVRSIRVGSTLVDAEPRLKSDEQ